MNQIAWTLFVGHICVVNSFTTTNIPAGYSTKTLQLTLDEFQEKDTSTLSNTRRDLLLSSLAVSVAGLGFPSLSNADNGDEPAPTPTKEADGVLMYKTKSGLKYIDLEPGKPEAKSPRYGQMCIVDYTAYLKLPNAKDKEKYDSANDYIIKHGNGRMISGLDEGLHTMKVGGLRRIIIPPKLGYVESGLGPLPEYPWSRWKLNGLLEDMVKQQGGNLVYDVRLLRLVDDEADQGYYEDLELSPDEFEEIQNKLARRSDGVVTQEAIPTEPQA